MGSRAARMLALGALALGALGFAAPAAAQDDYPNKTVTLVVPYPPGGGVDVLARVVAEKLSGVLGHQVIVDNRVGGSGLVGTRAVIRSAPDGYTLFLGHTGSISINPSLYANSGFDPRKDFTAIGLFASMPVALLAHPSFPAKTIGEVVELAKKEGGKLNIGTSAVGTGGYLSAELFKSITGVQATIVPYKGTAQLMNDLLGGHVPIAFGVLPPAMGNLAAGTLARHRDARQAALQPAAQHSDLARVGTAGLRVGAALRAARTGRHAAPDRRTSSTPRCARSPTPTR